MKKGQIVDLLRVLKELNRKISPRLLEIAVPHAVSAQEQRHLRKIHEIMKKLSRVLRKV